MRLPFGLRLSLFGGALFVVSLLALIVLPNDVPIVGVMAGGVLVWTGFIVTIFSYYRNSTQEPPEG